MKKISLNGIWKMTGAGFECEGKIPGSVYSFLLDSKLMEDPFYRMNELEALNLMENEFEFSKTFLFTPTGDKVLLHCDGLDTLCDIYVNDAHVAYTDNMHRVYEFDVTDLLKEGENVIRIVFYSADTYIREKQKEDMQYEPWHCTEGAGHLRKAHCMMGWDWGPRLPDAGIWKNIELVELDSARITDFHIVQRHEGGKVYVTPFIETDRDADITVTVTTPDDVIYIVPANQETEIENPQLWWPNGFGEQPLYTVHVVATEQGKEVDAQEKRIGLRTLKLIREKDQFGECFCHEVNGVRFFAMGADYIPEDNILSRITPERTYRLIKQCRDSNFNKTLAGLEIIDAKTLKIKPFIAEKVEWANAYVKMPSGKASCRWEKQGEEIILELEVPFNVTATVHLSKGETLEIGSGIYRFQLFY